MDIKIILHENLSLHKNEIYLVDCKEYIGKTLRLRTGSFDTSIIKGNIKNVNTELSTCSIEYENCLFENCVFNDGSWIDTSTFNNCKFKNCKFYGGMRWITFDSCFFINTEFAMNYIRATTFKKNCKHNHLTIKTKQIDEYVKIFGINYKEYNSERGLISLGFL